MKLGKIAILFAVYGLVSTLALSVPQLSPLNSTLHGSFLNLKSSLSVTNDQYLSDNGYPQSCSVLDQNCAACSAVSNEPTNLLSNGDFEDTQSTGIDITDNGISEVLMTLTTLPGGWYSSSTFLYMYSRATSNFQASLTDYSGLAESDICQDVTTQMNEPYLIRFTADYTATTVNTLNVSWESEEIVLDYAQQDIGQTTVSLIVIADSATSTLCFRYALTDNYEFGYTLDNISVVKFNPEVCVECSFGFFFDGTSGYCAHCYESIVSCETCSTDGSQCIQCESGFRLNEDGSCTRDVRECAEFNESGDCIVCNEGFKLKSVSNLCVTLIDHIQYVP